MTLEKSLFYSPACEVAIQMNGVRSAWKWGRRQNTLFKIAAKQYLGGGGE